MTEPMSWWWLLPITLFGVFSLAVLLVLTGKMNGDDDQD